MYLVYLIYRYSKEGYFIKRGDASSDIELTPNAELATIFPSEEAAKQFIRVLKIPTNSLEYAEVVKFEHPVKTEDSVKKEIDQEQLSKEEVLEQEENFNSYLFKENNENK